MIGFVYLSYSSFVLCGPHHCGKQTKLVLCYQHLIED